MSAVGADWIAFQAPGWLLALPAAAVPVLSARLMGRNRQRPALRAVGQSLAVLLAVLALARPAVRLGQAPGEWLILRDVSPSVGREQAAAPLPTPGVPSTPQRFADRPLRPGQPPDKAETNLSPVLDLAMGSWRDGRIAGIVLATDGRFHDDWRESAGRIGQAATPMLIVPLDAAPHDARIAAFRAARREGPKARGRSADRVDLRLTVAANCKTARTLTVRRLAPVPATLWTKQLRLEPDRPVTLRLSDDLEAGRTGLWEAALSPEDELPGDDALRSAVPTDARRFAWMASDSAPPPAGLAKALGDQLAVVSLTEAPGDVEGWRDYAGVFLPDAAGKALPDARKAALARFVLAGGGLVLIGPGPRDAPAGRDDPLRHVAALLSDPFRRRPLDLTLLLDASGSMAEGAGEAARTKWALVAEAVLALRDHLTARDRLRVIRFAGEAKAVYDSAAGPVDWAALKDALSAVHPAGPTDVWPALKQAAADPPGKDRTGLVIVLSDLQTKDFDAPASAEAFRRNGWRMAVVAITAGPQGPKQPPLERLAGLLNAPMIRRSHLRGLAEVFGRLCRRADEELKRGRFCIAAGGEWKDFGRLPPLEAYAPCVAARGAQVLARVAETGDPLLAWRQAGLGRSVGLACPLEGPENRSWREGRPSRLVASLLAGMMRQAAGPAGDGRFDATLNRRGNDVSVTVRAREKDEWINGLSLQVEVQPLEPPQSAAAHADLRQFAPGQYEASLAAPGDVRTPVAAAIRDAATGKILWRGISEAGYPPEYSALGADWETLRELAALTGGRIVRTEELGPAIQACEAASPARARRDAWPILLATALALMLLAWLPPFRRWRHTLGA